MANYSTKIINKTDFIVYGKEDNYDIPLESMGKVCLDYLKKRNPQDVVMMDAETEEILTTEVLIKNSIKFAILLQTLGVRKGDIISMISDNSIRYCETLLGAWYNGVLCNPLNSEYSVGEFKHALGTSQPKLIICCKQALDKIIQLKADFNFPCELITIGNESENVEPYRDIKNLLLPIEIDVQTFKPVELDCFEDGALILLSSGTTGLPKCVVLSHFSVGCLLAFLKSRDYYCSSTLVTVQIVPNFHLFGFAIQLVSMFLVKTILMKKFIPDLFLGVIEKYKVNVLYTVPSILQYLCKHPLVEKYDISSLRDVVVGAAPVGATLLNEAQNKFRDLFVMELYGSTEIGVSCCQKRKLYKPTSAGTLCPGFVAKVCDTNLNKSVGPFEQGELCFKSKQIMKGYLRNEAATRDSFDEDGFYHTGDYGYYDNDKCFYVTDRIKELIKYKGFQVPPAELESLINSIPGVQDCGVVGIPDEKAGEVPLAVVVKQKLANITEKDIINYVAENISVQKHLYGGVIFTNEIPRTGSGKILRRKLHELLETQDMFNK